MVIGIKCGISGEYKKRTFAIATAHIRVKETVRKIPNGEGYHYPIIWLTNIDSSGKMFLGCARVRW